MVFEELNVLMRFFHRMVSLQGQGYVSITWSFNRRFANS